MKIGILTFHHSYNCGSMLQAFALQTVLLKLGHEARIINFSNLGQQELYRLMSRPRSLKALAKNAVLLPHFRKIQTSFNSYEQFMRDYFIMDENVISDPGMLSDAGFDCIVAGSDQIWNITIADSDDAYFLPWVKNAKKIAYAPSFGAKDIARFASDPAFYSCCIKSFDRLSVRERNGQAWIKNLTGLDVPVVLDPTLLLDVNDYSQLEDCTIELPDEYIFYYSPGYSRDINALVKEVGKRYGMPVIAFNAKAYHLKGMGLFSGFTLPTIENPSSYLSLIKNASMVFTTSFHGTIFSAQYGKTFWTVKNGGMFGDDDRVLTLMDILGLEERLVPISYDEHFDYMKELDFTSFQRSLKDPRSRSYAFLEDALS